MPTEKRFLKVFLCHSSQDKSAVRELCQRLGAEGWIDPWLDEEKLLPGQNWDMAIEKAVEAADAVIVFLSNNSVTKEGYVQRELKYVLDIALEKPEGSIFVIPIRLNDCEVPRRIRSWQYVDFFPKSNYERAYGRLVASLQVRALSLNVASSYPGIRNDVPLLEIGPNLVSVGGEAIPLTRNEFLFLQFLANHNGICSRTEIIEAIYGASFDAGVYDSALNSLFKRLRRKLENDIGAFNYLRVVPKQGFELVNWTKIS